ncbi:MAG: helix-turn-helix domain-containing protein [Providencia sp.]|uniref:helix-turn-helix domain-containing protein n=1 Tax=Providencia sp. TaxID=589 RepID=UPI001B72E310|nr:helix-turn-helix domain-containing protein [Providencia sp.]MBP6083342.1 helix-turn-helix domain-containing protein [Providencia sp.]
MGTLEELLAKRSPESLKRIEARVEELRREITLSKMREELNISQVQLAELLGIKQPAVVKMEKLGNDPKLSTIKRYVKALGGELSLDVTLSNGKKLELHL